MATFTTAQMKTAGVNPAGQDMPGVAPGFITLEYILDASKKAVAAADIVTFYDIPTYTGLQVFGASVAVLRRRRHFDHRRWYRWYRHHRSDGLRCSNCWRNHQAGHRCQLGHHHQRHFVAHAAGQHGRSRSGPVPRARVHSADDGLTGRQKT